MCPQRAAEASYNAFAWLQSLQTPSIGLTLAVDSWGSAACLPAVLDARLELQLVAFFDYGTDWKSAHEVLGRPAVVRGKPGQGWGTGIGLRARTPVGPLRLEYAVNDQGQRPGWRLNVGTVGML